jgi:hypothetical protein
MGKVTISRAVGSLTFPSECMLVAAMRSDAVARLEQVQAGAEKPQPDKSKISRILKPMLKWGGDRFTKAIDAALGAVIATTLKPTP